MHRLHSLRRRNRLAPTAKAYRVKIGVLRRVGHFAPACWLGPTRTLRQDAESGVLQVVDIALKGISPAVNDPSIAINCVDQLSAAPHSEKSHVVQSGPAGGWADFCLLSPALR
jgi:hypothetical protein